MHLFITSQFFLANTGGGNKPSSCKQVLLVDLTSFPHFCWKRLREKELSYKRLCALQMHDNAFKWFEGSCDIYRTPKAHIEKFLHGRQFQAGIKIGCRLSCITIISLSWWVQAHISFTALLQVFSESILYRVRSRLNWCFPQILPSCCKPLSQGLQYVVFTLTAYPLRTQI